MDRSESYTLGVSTAAEGGEGIAETATDTVVDVNTPASTPARKTSALRTNVREKPDAFELHFLLSGLGHSVQIHAP